DTSIDSVDQVKKTLENVFEDNLKTYSVEVRDVSPYTEGESSGTQATMIFGTPDDPDAGISHEALQTRLEDALKASGHEGIEPLVTAPGYTAGSSKRIYEWTVKLGLPVESAQALLDQVVAQMRHEPVFPLANKIGSRVAG